jgi:hypothetical protein
MKYLPLILLLSGCSAMENPKPGLYTLSSGYSMSPVLQPGDYYLLTNVPWSQVETGMIVERWHLGKRYVHKVGEYTRHGWETYGINNRRADPSPMAEQDFIGVVEIQ